MGGSRNTLTCVHTQIFFTKPDFCVEKVASIFSRLQLNPNTRISYIYDKYSNTIMITGNPPPGGFFFLGWFSNEEPRGRAPSPFSSRHFIWKPPQKEDPPGGWGFFRSICKSYTRTCVHDNIICEYHICMSVCACVCVYASICVFVRVCVSGMCVTVSVFSVSFVSQSLSLCICLCACVGGHVCA